MKHSERKHSNLENEILKKEISELRKPNTQIRKKYSNLENETLKKEISKLELAQKRIIQTSKMKHSKTKYPNLESPPSNLI